MYVMEHTLRPSRREHALSYTPPKSCERKQYEDERDLKILADMWKMVVVGLSSFLGGFLFWNIDNRLCEPLQGWRHTIGLPWGLLLEGHGYWHIFTGVGAYMYIVWGIWLRHCLNGRQDEYQFIWSRLWTLPYIVRRKRKPMDIQAPITSAKLTEQIH
ncbi:hypothetical protein KEM54_005286 [Ascosphaera aggregata]|nr:hypothetical protein KEM54_005286 [Ascosphaera aggregata]